MKPLAYYSEFNRQKAAWLRHLIEEGVIAHGVVDERPIQAIQPEDLAGFTQCHFFAGVGVWSYALRLAGWPDDRPVWTGSCPCGPFSRAGKQEGFADPRHLWPVWLPIILKCGPDVLFGEQSDAADAWVDLVSSDLEDNGYSFGAPDIPAAGFGGAHIRQRFYWVADADNTEWWSERAPWHDGDWPKTRRIEGNRDTGYGSADGWLADADDQRGNWSAALAGEAGRGQSAIHGGTGGLGYAGSYGSPAHTRDHGQVRRVSEAQRQSEQRTALSRGPGQFSGLVDTSGGGLRVGQGGVSYIHQPDRSGVADWLYCRDALWRPVEPGTCPLVDASPARMGRLRGYGDAIDAEAAAQFVSAYLDSAPQRAAA